MADIRQATIAGIGRVKDVLSAPGRFGSLIGAGAVWGGSALTERATGISPVHEAFQLFDPITAFQLGLVVNPFRGPLRTFRYGGLIGYRALIGGGIRGPVPKQLTIGNLLLSTIQGTARALGRIPESLLGTERALALQHARRVGLAGVFNPRASVFALSEEMVQKGRLTELGRKKIIEAFPKRPARWLSRLAGEGVRTPASAAKVAKIVKTGESTYHAIVRPLTGRLEAAPIKLTGKLGALGGVALRGFSVLMWAELLGAALRPAGQALLEGAGQASLQTLYLMRSLTGMDITSGRLPQSFMTAGAATERQRAVQAIYRAKVNPSNRFLGREANFYHDTAY